MKIAGVIRESIVDGPGLRFVIFAQGCPHKCIGCHNPQTHDFNLGTEIEVEKLLDEIRKNPLLKGVTFSGGEPFCQAKEFYKLGVDIKSTGLDLIAYTGYTFEEIVLLDDEYSIKLLEILDVVIDGKFEESNKSLMLNWRGSNNQRVIDVKKTLELSKIVEIK